MPTATRTASPPVPCARRRRHCIGAPVWIRHLDCQRTATGQPSRSQRGLDVAVVEQLVKKYTDGRQLLVLGEPGVNVVRRTSHSMMSAA